MEFLLDKIRATKNNGEFFDSMRRGVRLNPPPSKKGGGLAKQETQKLASCPFAPFADETGGLLRRPEVAKLSRSSFSTH
jgi:hypothetical protein